MIKPLLDHKGNPVHFSYKGAKINTSEIDYYTNFSSISCREEKILNEGDRLKLLSNLRNSYRNNIITNTLISTLQTNVGKVQVKSTTGNQDFDTAREEYFKKWTRDIEITNQSLGNVIKLVIAELALAGDCLIVLLKNGKIQLVPSERICSATNPENRKQDEISGCRINKFGAITHFRICGYDAMGNVDRENGTYILAKDAIFIRNQTRIGSIRGIPYLANAVNILQSIEEIHSSYTTKIKVNSLFACAITSNSPYDERWSGMANSSEPNRSNFTTLESGSLLMLEDGENITQIDASKGANEVEKFLIYLISFVSAPIVGSIESLLGFSNASFASSRVTKTQSNFKFTQYREMLEDQILRRLFNWKTRKLQKFGDLPDNIEFSDYEDQMRFSWTYLPVLDSEKQSKVDASMIENNLISYTELFAEKGKDFEQEIKQIAKDKLLVQELMGGSKDTSDGGSNIKELVDAYGVAVRGGSITPQQKDEEHIRKLLDMPSAEKPVQDAWDEDGGKRRPITLVQPGKDDSQEIEPNVEEE